jgi:ABC-type branched-subunit amino acid transport system ATPase component
VSGKESINAEGLSPSVIKSLEAMIATLRDELEQKTIQPEQAAKKYPWTVIESVKIGVVTREDFYDDL